MRLARRVEMYQWVPQGDGYSQGWSAEPVEVDDSAHANPPFPLESDRWLPKAITIDGHALAPDAVEALAQWREFRPGFSALPGNLSATFQPEGNGLGSAENPLDPQVGDLRIHWLERSSSGGSAVGKTASRVGRCESRVVAWPPVSYSMCLTNRTDRGTRTPSASPVA